MSSFEVVFIFEVAFFFEVVFIFEVIFEVVVILRLSTQLRQGLARVLELIIIIIFIESKTAYQFYEYITRKKCFWLKTVFKYRDLGRMKNS